MYKPIVTVQWFIILIMPNKYPLSNMSFSGIQKRLQEELFVQTHKSYLINLDQYAKVIGNDILLKNEEKSN